MYLRYHKVSISKITRMANMFLQLNVGFPNKARSTHIRCINTKPTVHLFFFVNYTNNELILYLHPFHVKLEKPYCINISSYHELSGIVTYQTL